MVRGRLWPYLVLLLGIPTVFVLAVRAGERWQAVFAHARSGPFALTSAGAPGTAGPGDFLVVATVAGGLALVAWCVRVGDAGVRARRGFPALPVLAACAAVAFVWGTAFGFGALLVAALASLGAYRLVLRLASGGYTDDGASFGPDSPEDGAARRPRRAGSRERRGREETSANSPRR